jgi:hypothetical protein
VLPIGFSMATAALGATFLPFWPTELVALLVLLTGLASWLDPRLGMALALATPIFPLGNVAAAAALLYGLFAAGWVALNWRDGRHGLWFMSGPLLAGFGLLALVPLVLLPVRSTVRRAAHGMLAVFSTALLAGTGAIDLGPLDSFGSAALGVWTWLGAETLVTVTALGLGAAAAALPWARSRSRLGAAAVGFAVTAGFVLAGAGVASTIVVGLAWAGFAFAAAAPRRA